MSKYNRAGATRYAIGPTVAGKVINTAKVPTLVTHEGAPGYARDVKSEVFLLAASYFAGEPSFYENGQVRDTRFIDLIRSVAVTDPDWTRRFLYWLRREANIRTGSVVGAVEAADAMVKAKIPGSRAIVSAVLQRADEPGEALAYWLATRGRKIPKPIKRGVGDGAVKLYNQFNWLKWDSTRASVRFADVLELTHPDPAGPEQANLFGYILDSRHGHKQRDEDLIYQLPMIYNNSILRAATGGGHFENLLVPEVIKAAGFTWEDALSEAGPNVNKAKLWQALFPTMGYMALLRNLRNFDQAGISQAMINGVVTRLTDPEQVARSRQFPFRFLAAYQAVKSLTWGPALEKALALSLQNVPVLSGRTLVLVDRSGSMFGTISGKSELDRADQAALFGAALKLRNPQGVTLVEFGSNSQEVALGAGHSLLRAVSENFHSMGGTYTRAAMQRHYQNHDRVIIVTDEQAADGDPGTVVPPNVPMYTWNLAGYRASNTAGTARRYWFGGMTDQAFAVIPMIEAGQSQTWPF